MCKLNKLFLTLSAVLLLAACGDTQNDQGEAELVEQTEQAAEEVTESDESLTVSDSDDSGTNQEATQSQDTQENADSEDHQEIEPVIVTMVNSESEEIRTATFEEAEEGVRLDLSLAGLPEGEFGMHIHEYGSATPPTFEDAGSHFNPTDVEHGVESETGPHIGDLPNLVVPESGAVDEMFVLYDTTLDPEGENTLNSETGTSLIIHTEPDDYESQPTGDAGDRQAGGVIFSNGS